MLRRRRVVESEEESSEAESSAVETIESSSPIRRNTRLRKKKVQNDTDSEYEQESNSDSDEEDSNMSSNNNRNYNNRNRNRNGNNDDRKQQSQSQTLSQSQSPSLDPIQTQRLYTEAKNEIEGAIELLSDDDNDNDNNDSENDELMAETHPDFTEILPTFIQKLDKQFKKIDDDIKDCGLEQAIDTATSMSEYNSTENGYKNHTKRLQNAMDKLLNLSKDIKTERLMFSRVISEMRSEDRMSQNENNPILTGNWDTYFDTAREEAINEVNIGTSAQSKAIKAFTEDAMGTYKEQFRDAIFVEDIEECDSDVNDNNRNRNRNKRDSDGSDDDIDIVIDKSGKSGKGKIRCPLTNEVFKRPFRSKLCQHTFEKEAIFAYIAEKNRQGIAKCPLVGCEKELVKEQMIRDIKMEKLIRAQNRVQQTQESDEEGTFDLTMQI